MSKIKKLVSDTILYGFTTVVTRMIGFVMTPIYTKSFTNPGVYGVFTNMYSYAALVNAVLALGMETTYFRFLNRVEEKDKNKVFNNSFAIIISVVALFIFTVFLFASSLGAWFASTNTENTAAEYTSFVKYFAIMLSADALAVVPFAKLRSDGRPIRFSAIKFANIFVLVVLNLFFLFWLPSLVKTSSFWADFASGWFVMGWVGNVFIANLIASIFTLILLIPQITTFRFELDRALVRSMFSYSFPILIANISFIINEHLDKMMFPRLVPGDIGERDLGVYGAVAKLAVFLNLFVTAFRLGVEPFLFSHAKNANAKPTYALIMDYFIIIMVLVMVGISANIEWLKYFIVGSKDDPGAYWSGLYILPILLFNNVLLGVYMNLSIWYKLSDQTRYAIYISGAGALLTIILNIIFIPKYSYVGACIATTATYLLMVVMSYVWGQKNYAIPYHTKKNVVYLLSGAAISAIMVYVLDGNLWLSNLLLIGFVLIVFMKEKTSLLAFLKSK